MKVSVTVAIDLDAEDWTTTFGVEGAKAIRQDVKDYVVSLVRDAGVFGNGEVEAKIASRA